MRRAVEYCNGARPGAAGDEAGPRGAAHAGAARPPPVAGGALMCGIVGILGAHEAAPQLLEALKRLEYRGYDSAGIATVDAGRLDRRRATGKLVNLADLLVHEPLAGKAGIGHTRWATHGAPTVGNAHPHRAGPVAVVHNGIIENFRALREELTAGGYAFESETDTEADTETPTDTEADTDRERPRPRGESERDRDRPRPKPTEAPTATGGMTLM